MELTAPLAAPVFSMVIVPTQVDPVRTAEVAEICAVLVKDPNRPNTNPAIAIAAMSVIAMRMTVAMTGEMAFLPFPCVIFIISKRS